MSPSAGTKIAVCFIVLGLSRQIASAENKELVNWRVWNTSDGMVEAFVSQVTIAPSGHIIIRHGDVTSLEVLDGIKLSSIPDLHGLSRIQADAAGSLYTFDSAGLQVFQQGTWDHKPVPDIAHFPYFGSYPNANWFDYPNTQGMKSKVSIAVSDPGKVLISTGGELLEWSLGGQRRVLQNSRRSAVGSFLEVSRAGPGQFFVSALHGLALLNPTTNTWSEFPLLPFSFTRVSSPSYAADGDILVTANSIDGRKHLLRNHKGVWTSLYGSHAMVRGWETSEGHVWVMENNRLIEIVNGQATNFELGPDLTGRLRDVAIDGQTFWLGTMQGLARYAPPLWSIPEGAPADLRATVGAITQDGKGVLWVWSGDHVIRKALDKWQSYKLPRGEIQNMGKTGAVCPMRNGTVLLQTENTDHFLELLPATGTFRRLVHPEGRQIKWIEKRDEDTIWVVTLQIGENASRLEVYDGKHFTPVPGGQGLPTNDVRAILQTKAGVIWVGGTSGLTRIVNGRMEGFPKSSGLLGNSAFSLLEGPDSTVYVGQRDALLAYDGVRFRIIRRGLNRVRRLAISSDGTIWAASGGGIHRYSGGEWITNTAEDGLPSNAASTVFVDGGNRIWVGTTLGLSTYHPAADTSPPYTVIEEGQNLRESPPDGEVRLTFSGTDMWKQTASSRLLFSWRLDGKEWSPYEQISMVAARKIPSGQHVFEVRAMDRNGNREVHPARFSFAVLYPWYRESGFYLIGGVLLLAIFLLLRIAYTYYRDLCIESRYDPVTKLPNRRQFEEALALAVEQRTVPNPGFAIIFIDLDGFKGVNDYLGHAAGDRVLANLGARLQKELFKGDLLARIGGDEFAILLCSAIDREAIEQLANRLRKVIRSCSPDSHSPISGSLGISLFPEHGNTPSGLVRFADLAMYQSKSRSGDCQLFYDPGMKFAQLNPLPRDTALPQVKRRQFQSVTTQQ